jgi:hypothetical protein
MNNFFSIDIVDPCINNTCQNGATCVRDGLTSYKCNCAPGFGDIMCNLTLPSIKIILK